MTQEQESPAKEVGALMGADNFHGFEIREWTLKQFVSLSATLEAMLQGIQKRGISWGQIAALFDSGPAKKKAEDPEAKDLTPIDGAAIIAAVLPEIPAFLSISLARPVEEIEALDLPTASVLAIRVIGKNLAHFQSFFVDLAREVGTLKMGRTLSPGDSV